jgi:hypothetical protein
MHRRAVLALLAALTARPHSGFAADRLNLRIGTATLEVHFAGGEEPDGGRALFERWIRQSADAVASYFGRFPISAVKIIVVLGPGVGVRGGRTHVLDGEVVISVRIGKQSGESDLLVRDWVMVHEMIHTSHPQLPRNFFWFAEGMAVYVEAVCRVRAGHLAAETVFADFMRDMPKGLPKEGDRGLDRTPTWGRTYWGGAMFFLLADAGIRKTTANRLGLIDALRAMNRRHDYSDAMTDVNALIAIGDTATGTDVLSKLYRDMGGAPFAPQLDSLWYELGISSTGGRVTIDDAAPASAIRDAIFAPAD